MYFYVFLQPEVFEEAAEDGEDAIQNVTAILSGFLQNCFLAVFEDDRWEPATKEKLENWPATLTRRRVKSILVQLKKRNRFLYCIVPDYGGVRPDLDCVFEQATSIPLDLILVITSERNRPVPAGGEVATRQSYQHTAFEPKRSDLAVYGKTCGAGEMDEASFLDFHFAKALKHADVIHICDRVCGKYSFMANFRYTIKRFITWLGTILPDSGNCKIVFHIGKPEGKGIHFVLSELTSLKSGTMSGATFEVHFYDETLPDATLPHQRFILTNQVALDIDRGLDFLNQTTSQCRDTYINYQNPKDAHRLLSSYSSGCVSTHLI